MLRDPCFTTILKHSALSAQFKTQLDTTIMHLKLVRIAAANVRASKAKTDRAVYSAQLIFVNYYGGQRRVSACLPANVPNKVFAELTSEDGDKSWPDSKWCHVNKCLSSGVDV